MLATLAFAAGSAQAFVAPSAFNGNQVVATKSTSALQMADISDLPGALPPLGAWDPLGLSNNINEDGLRQYREAELKHGRVAMMAVVGMLVQEAFHPLFPLLKTTDIGPAIYHFQLIESEYGPITWSIALALVAWIESKQILENYSSQDKTGLATFRGDVIVGDLGLRYGDVVDNEDKFLEYRQKELQNGRLAMIAIIGEWAQELVNGQELIENLTGKSEYIPIA